MNDLTAVQLLMTVSVRTVGNSFTNDRAAMEEACAIVRGVMERVLTEDQTTDVPLQENIVFSRLALPPPDGISRCLGSP
jgi:hypothetical protein